MTAMPRKWIRRAVWKPPSNETSPENWIGFQMARPVTTCEMPASMTTI